MSNAAGPYCPTPSLHPFSPKLPADTRFRAPCVSPHEALPGPSKYPQIGVKGPKLRVVRVYWRAEGGSRYACPGKPCKDPSNPPRQDPKKPQRNPVGLGDAPWRRKGSTNRPEQRLLFLGAFGFLGGFLGGLGLGARRVLLRVLLGFSVGLGV